MVTHAGNIRPRVKSVGLYHLIAEIMITNLSCERDSVLRNVKRAIGRIRIGSGKKGRDRESKERYARLQLQRAQIAIANHEAAGRLHGALKVDR